MVSTSKFQEIQACYATKIKFIIDVGSKTKFIWEIYFNALVGSIS
jgi:hypothetical protein